MWYYEFFAETGFGLVAIKEVINSSLPLRARLQVFLTTAKLFELSVTLSSHSIRLQNLSMYSFLAILIDYYAILPGSEFIVFSHL